MVSFVAKSFSLVSAQKLIFLQQLVEDWKAQVIKKLCLLQQKTLIFVDSIFAPVEIEIRKQFKCQS